MADGEAVTRSLPGRGQSFCLVRVLHPEVPRLTNVEVSFVSTQSNVRKRFTSSNVCMYSTRNAWRNGIFEVITRVQCAIVSFSKSESGTYLHRI